MTTLENIASDIDNINVAQVYCCTPEKCKDFISTDGSSFTIVHINIRSIGKNFDNFIATLGTTHLNYDVIVLTECWLKFNHILPSLNGYSVHFSKINLLQNDGVVL
jgi:hypothetical protein